MSTILQIRHNPCTIDSTTKYFLYMWLNSTKNLSLVGKKNVTIKNMICKTKQMYSMIYHPIVVNVTNFVPLLLYTPTTSPWINYTTAYLALQDKRKPSLKRGFIYSVYSISRFSCANNSSSKNSATDISKPSASFATVDKVTVLLFPLITHLK